MAYRESALKQRGIGGVKPHCTGCGSRLGSCSPASHPTIKAFFLTDLLKYSCVLLRCNDIKHKYTRNKAGLTINAPLYI